MSWSKRRRKTKAGWPSVLLSIPFQKILDCLATLGGKGLAQDRELGNPVLKKAFYKALAERLNHEIGVRTEDVFIGLLETKKEDWSFGNGIAQYVS